MRVILGFLLRCALDPSYEAAAAAERGIPVQRPLFMHYEDDPECYGLQFEYLLGRDVLVAPVWQAGVTEQSLYIPEGEWVHLWTGKVYGKGNNVVEAGIGYPPVFWRKGSGFAELFEKIRGKYGKQ